MSDEGYQFFAQVGERVWKIADFWSEMGYRFQGSIRTLPPNTFGITPPSPIYSQLTGFTQPTSAGPQGGLPDKNDGGGGTKVRFRGCSLECF